MIDEAVKMPDVATTAAIHVLRKRGFDVGPSTGLNFLVSLYKAHELKYYRLNLRISTKISSLGTNTRIKIG